MKHGTKENDFDSQKAVAYSTGPVFPVFFSFALFPFAALRWSVSLRRDMENAGYLCKIYLQPPANKQTYLHARSSMLHT